MSYTRFAVSRKDGGILNDDDIHFLSGLLEKHEIKGSFVGAYPSVEATYILPTNSGIDEISGDLQANGYKFREK